MNFGAADKQANGILAQLGEHLPYKQRVIGSSPIGPILFLNHDRLSGRFVDRGRSSFIINRHIIYMAFWRDSSVGKSTRFIPVVSGVQIPFPLCTSLVCSRLFFLLIH